MLKMASGKITEGEIREKGSDADRLSLDLNSTEEETAEKPSVAKASIILVLLRWEEIADLTSRCAAGELGWAGPGLGRGELD